MKLRPALEPSSPASGHLWKIGAGRAGGRRVRSVPSPVEARTDLLAEQWQWEARLTSPLAAALLEGEPACRP